MPILKFCKSSAKNVQHQGSSPRKETIVGPIDTSSEDSTSMTSVVVEYIQMKEFTFAYTKTRLTQNEHKSTTHTQLTKIHLYLIQNLERKEKLLTVVYTFYMKYSTGGFLDGIDPISCGDASNTLYSLDKSSPIVKTLATLPHR